MADEVQDNEQQTPDQGGPGPALSPENRAKLDAIVLKMSQQNATKEEVQSIVDDFKKKYTTPSIPKIASNYNPQQPTASESTAAPKPTVLSNPPTENTLDILKKKQSDAQNTLHNELTGNNELVPGIIKQQKFDTQAAQRLDQLQQQPRSDMPLTQVAQLGKSLAAPTPETTASDEEVNGFLQDAQTDPTTGRSFLNHIIKNKPDKAPAIQAAAYVNDATERLAQDPNGEMKSGKVLQNVSNLEKGKLTYDVKNGHLIKPEDTWQSIGTGLQQKNKAFDDYNLFSNANPADAIKELEKRRADYDPDEPTPQPKGFGGELAGGMASQPFKGLVMGKIAGAATALIPGVEEAAPAVDKMVSSFVSSNDFRKMSYANSLQQNYNQLRNEGMAPEEAYQKANGQAKDESMVDAAAGAAMMYAGGKIGEMKLPEFNLSNGFKGAVINSLKQGAKGIGEAGAVGLIQGAGQEAKNALAEDKGIQRSGSGDDIKEAIKSGTLFTLGMAALAKGGDLLSGKTRTGLLQGLSKATPEQVDAELGSQISQQHITPEEATAAKRDIDEHRTLDAGIPDNVTEESRLKIQDKIKRRDYLETQLESADKAFHPEIKEKIKAVNDDILELAKDKVARGETQGVPGPEPVEPTPDPTPQPEAPTGEIKPVSSKIKLSDRLRTWFLGDMEGKPEDEKAKKHIEGVVQAWDTKPAGNEGETFGEFIGRVIPAFKQILSGEDHNTTVITHSSVLKAFKVWDEMGRPDVESLTPEQKTEFATNFNKQETYNGDLETFKGDNGDIHVIRHGQTEDNEKNNFRSGETNLTPKGKVEAAEAGNELGRKTGGDVPKIITSDLPRAVDSANIIHGELTGEKGGESAVPENYRNEAKYGLPLKSDKYDFVNFSEAKKFADPDKYLRYLEKQGIIKIQC